MPGLVPGTHAVVRFTLEEWEGLCAFLQPTGSFTAWVPATSAGMTPLVGCGIDG